MSTRTLPIRRSIYCFAIAFVPLLVSAAAATTPMDTPLPDGKITTIHYEHTRSEPVSIGGGRVMSKPGKYKYNVFIPAGYNDPANAELDYPCLFVCAGGGNPNMKVIDAWVRRNRWIVVMVTDAKNGPWDPIFGAFLGAHDDAMERLRIRDGLKFATGASGGAAMTGYGITARRGFVGWVPVIGSAPGTAARQIRGLAIFGVFGRKDKLVPPSYVRNAVNEFRALNFDYTTHPGGHTWTTPAMETAMDWVRDQAMSSARLSPAEARHYLNPMIAEYEDTATLIGRRLELAQLITKTAGRTRLFNEPHLAEKLAQMKDFISNARRDPILRNEVEAYEAWEKATTNLVRLTDAAFIGEVKASDVPRLRERFEGDLNEITQKWPDTEIAKMLSK